MQDASHLHAVSYRPNWKSAMALPVL